MGTSTITGKTTSWLQWATFWKNQQEERNHVGVDTLEHTVIMGAIIIFYYFTMLKPKVQVLISAL